MFDKYCLIVFVFKSKIESFGVVKDLKVGSRWWSYICYYKDC